MNEGDRIDLALTIRHRDVMHFLGYPEGRAPAERISVKLEAMLAEARSLADGRGAFRLLERDEAARLGLEPVPEARLVIGLVSAGERIEARASEYMEGGDPVAALILDSAGSAAAEEAADRLGAIIAGEPGDRDSVATLSCRISPGYGGWKLDAQAALFERLPHEALGVALTPSMLMLPRKAVSFAMWLGADARPVAGLSGCSRCELETCRYRTEPRSEGTPTP